MQKGRPDSGPVRQHGLRFLTETVVNIVLPYLIYRYGAPRYGDATALTIAAMPPLLHAAVDFLYRRRVDAFSLFLASGLLLSVLAVMAGGSARMLLLREALIKAVIGTVFLISVLAGRPLIFYLARAVARRGSPEDVAEFEARQGRPRFRRVMKIMTLTWGAGLITAALINSVLVFRLTPARYLIIHHFVSYGIIGCLILWTVLYRRRAEAREEEEKEPDDQTGLRR